MRKDHEPAAHRADKAMRATPPRTRPALPSNWPFGPQTPRPESSETFRPVSPPVREAAPARSDDLDRLG